MGSAATKLASVALVLLAACSGGDERAEPAEPPELTDVSVPPPATPCEVLATEIEPNPVIDSARNHPPTPTVASSLAVTSSGLVPILPVAEPWSAHIFLTEEAALLPEVEELVRSIAGLSTVATLWPVDLAEARLAELAPYPQLAGQISIVGGPVVLVAGDDDAVASLARRMAEDLGMDDAVFTDEREAEFDDFNRRTFVARLRERQADLDLLEALGGPAADAAAVLASTAPEDLVDGLPEVRAAMDEILAFASGTCGLQLFRAAGDPPLPVDPAAWASATRIALFGWRLQVNTELRPAVTGPNALPPDGDGPDWTALEAACATFRDAAKDARRWIDSAPQDAEPIADALADLASLHQQFADDCTAAAAARNLLLLDVAVDTARAIEQDTAEIVELLDEYRGD